MPSLTRSEAFWARDGCRRTGTGGIRPQTFEGPCPLGEDGRSRHSLRVGDLPAGAGISARRAALGGANFPSGAPPGGGGVNGSFFLPHRVRPLPFPSGEGREEVPGGSDGPKGQDVRRRPFPGTSSRFSPIGTATPFPGGLGGSPLGPSRSYFTPGGAMPREAGRNPFLLGSFDPSAEA